MTRARLYDMVSVSFDDRSFMLEDRRREMRFCNTNLHLEGKTPQELYDFAKQQWESIFRRYKESRGL